MKGATDWVLVIVDRDVEVIGVDVRPCDDRTHANEPPPDRVSQDDKYEDWLSIRQSSDLVSDKPIRR
jgi:hypothetical protein